MVGHLIARVFDERRGDFHVADLRLDHAIAHLVDRRICALDLHRHAAPRATPVVALVQRLLDGGEPAGQLRDAHALERLIGALPLAVGSICVALLLVLRLQLHGDALGAQTPFIVAVVFPVLGGGHGTFEGVFQRGYRTMVRAVGPGGRPSLAAGRAGHNAVGGFPAGQRLFHRVRPGAAVGRPLLKPGDGVLPGAVGGVDLRPSQISLASGAGSLQNDVLLLPARGLPRKREVYARRTRAECVAVVVPLLGSLKRELLSVIRIRERHVNRVVIRSFNRTRHWAARKSCIPKLKIAQADARRVAVDALFLHVVLPQLPVGRVDVQVLERVRVLTSRKLVSLDNARRHALRLAQRAVVRFVLPVQHELDIRVVVTRRAPVEQLLHRQLALVGVVDVVDEERAGVAVADGEDLVAVVAVVVFAPILRVLREVHIPHFVHVDVARRAQQPDHHLAGAVLVEVAVLVVQGQRVAGRILGGVVARMLDAIGVLVVPGRRQLGHPRYGPVANGHERIALPLHAQRGPRRFIARQLLLQKHRDLRQVVRRERPGQVGPQLRAVGNHVA